MPRRFALCLCALSVLAAAPVARAGRPSTGPVQDGTGLLSTDGGTYYFAVGIGSSTVLESVQTPNGGLHKSVLAGSWGIPNVTLNGDAGGLSADGKTLVLASMVVGSPSRFLIVNTRTLRVTNRVVLNGNFAFDALSPDGAHLYLIQHTSVNDLTHYVVRSYALPTHRLLEYPIADKTQQNWVMQGYAMTRATSPGGRWVYTLYQNPGGYPFIHALDTVQGVAHCIGLPWTGDQTKLSNIALTLGDGGKTLSVHWKSGHPWLAVNTVNWNIAHVQAAASSVSVRPGGLPWRWILVVAGGAIVLALVLGLAASRSRRFRLSRAAA